MDVAQLGFNVNSDGLLAGIKNIDKLDDAGKRFEKTSASTGKTTKTSGDLISQSMGRAGLGIDKASKASSGLLSVMSRLGPLLGGVSFAALTGSTSKYIGALQEVSTLVDTTTFDMAELSASALEQSKTFGSMPTATVKAYYQAISAGAGTAEKATLAVEAANKLAIGGVTDVTTAVDGLTSVMNAYGGEAGNFTQISDTMFVGMRDGKTTIGELSSAIGNVAPLAAQAGVSFEEVVSATAALTKGGQKTSVAMNGLRAIVAAVVKPTKEAQDAALALGLNFNAAALESQGLAGFLEEVRDKTGGSSDALSVLFGGVEALTPIMALTGKSAGDFASTLESMAEKAGATEDAVTKMVNSPGFQMQRILATLSAGWIGLTQSLTQGAVPALKLVADSIGPLFAAVEQGAARVGAVYDTFVVSLKSSDSLAFAGLRALGDVFETVFDALSPVIPLFGDFLGVALSVAAAAGGLSLVASAVGTIGTAVGALGALLLANPITASIAAIAGAAYLIYDNWDGIVDWWEGLWGSLNQSVADFLDWFESTFPEIADVFGNVWDVVEAVTTAGWDMLTGIWSAQWAVLSELVDAGGKLLVGDFQGAWDAVVDTVFDLIERIQEAFKGLPAEMLEIGSDILAGLVAGIQSGAGAVADSLIEMGDDAVSAVKSFFGIRSPSRLMMGFGEFVSEGFAIGITNKSLDAIAAARRMSEEVAEAGRGAIDGLIESLASADGLDSALDNLTGKLESWWRSTAQDWAKRELTAKLGLDGSGASGVLGALGGEIGKFATAAKAAAGPAALMVAGMVALKSALSSTTSMTAEGFEVGYSGGNVSGNNVQEWEKDGGLFRSSRVWDVLSGLDKEIDNAVTSYFGSMTASIVNTAQVLGVEGANSILDGYEVAVQRFTGANTEAELQAWLEQSTANAYALAFQSLSPEIQGLVSDGMDVMQQPVQESLKTFQQFAVQQGQNYDTEWELRQAYNAYVSRSNAEYAGLTAEWEAQNVDLMANMQEVTIVAGNLVPQFEAMGANFGSTTDEMITNIYTLAQEMGGAAVVAERMALFVSEFVPAGERYNVAVGQAQLSLDGFNESLGLTSGAAIDTREEMYQYIQGLDLTTEAGREAYAAAMLQLEAIVAVENAQIEQAERINAVADATRILSADFLAAAPSAQAFSDKVVELVGGMDQLQIKTNTMYDLLFTEQEQQQIALAEAAVALQGYNDQLGLSGESAINNAEDLQAFIDQQIASGGLTAEQTAILLNMSTALDAVNSSGLTVADILGNLPPELAAVAGAFAQTTGDMSAAAQAQSATALLAAGDVEGASAAIDAALSGVSDELDYTSAEADALNASLGLAGEAAITTTSQLQDYASALDLNTEAGSSALDAIEGFVVGIDGATSNTSEATAGVEDYAIQVQALSATMVDASTATEAATSSLGAGLENVSTGLTLASDVLNTSTASMTDAIATMAGGVTETSGAVAAANDSISTSLIDLAQNSVAANDAISVSFDSTAQAASVSSESIAESSELIGQNLGNVATSAESAAVLIDGSAVEISESVDFMATGIAQNSDSISSASTQIGEQFGVLSSTISTTAEGVNLSTTAMNDAMLGMANEVAATSGSMGESVTGLAGAVIQATSDKVAAHAAQSASYQALDGTMSSSTALMSGNTATLGNVFEQLGASMLQTAANIEAATSRANGALSGFGGAINGTASAASSAASVAAGAASSAAKSANSAADFASSAGSAASKAASAAGSAASAAGSAANAASSAASAVSKIASTQIKGSFMTGTDYIKSDGLYELHRTEVVLNPAESQELRTTGSVARFQQEQSAFSSQSASGSSSQIVQELKAMRKELEQIKSDNREAAEVNARGHQAVADNTRQQVVESQSASRASNQALRQVAKAVAA